MAQAADPLYSYPDLQRVFKISSGSLGSLGGLGSDFPELTEAPRSDPEIQEAPRSGFVSAGAISISAGVISISAGAISFPGVISFLVSFRGVFLFQVCMHKTLHRVVLFELHMHIYMYMYMYMYIAIYSIYKNTIYIYIYGFLGRARALV